MIKAKGLDIAKVREGDDEEAKPAGGPRDVGNASRIHV